MMHIHLTLEFVSSLGEESWTCVLLHWLSSLAPSLPWGFVNFQALVALHWDSLLEENGHREQQSTHHLGDKYSSKRYQGKCHWDTKNTPCRSSMWLAVPQAIKVPARSVFRFPQANLDVSRISLPLMLSPEVWKEAIVRRRHSHATFCTSLSLFQLPQNQKGFSISFQGTVFVAYLSSSLLCALWKKFCDLKSPMAWHDIFKTTYLCVFKKMIFLFQ